MELDETDKAIIRELQIDGRLPYAKLAPLVGLSQAATRQRTNRLVDAGVMQIVAVTDPLMVGLATQAMLAITIDGDAKQVAATLGEIPQVEYVVIVSGRYDILAEVVCHDTDELLDLLNDTIRPIPGIASTEALTYLRLVKQTYSWGTG